jgi:hypothetical protein
MIGKNYWFILFLIPTLVFGQHHRRKWAWDKTAGIGNSGTGYVFFVCSDGNRALRCWEWLHATREFGERVYIDYPRDGKIGNWTTSAGRGVSISPVNNNEVLLAFAGNERFYIHNYDENMDNVIYGRDYYLAGNDSVPSAHTWAKNGEAIACGTGNSPHLHIWKVHPNVGFGPRVNFTNVIVSDIDAVAWSPSNDWIAITDLGQSIKPVVFAWEPETANGLGVRHAPTEGSTASRVRSLDWSDNQNYLFVGADNRLEAYEWTNGFGAYTYLSHSLIHDVEYFKQGTNEYVAVVGINQTTPPGNGRLSVYQWTNGFGTRYTTNTYASISGSQGIDVAVVSNRFIFMSIIYPDRVMAFEFTNNTFYFLSAITNNEWDTISNIAISFDDKQK